VKKFRNLWYTGLAIIGIPTVIILFASFLVLVKNIKKQQTIQMEENKSRGLIGYTRHQIDEIKRRQPFVQR
jgi:hypothetical protein